MANENLDIVQDLLFDILTENVPEDKVTQLRQAIEKAMNVRRSSNNYFERDMRIRLGKRLVDTVVEADRYNNRGYTQCPGCQAIQDCTPDCTYNEDSEVLAHYHQR